MTSYLTTLTPKNAKEGNKLNGLKLLLKKTKMGWEGGGGGGVACTSGANRKKGKYHTSKGNEIGTHLHRRCRCNLDNVDKVIATRIKIILPYI